MAIRFALLVVASVLLLLSIFACPAKAAAVFLPRYSPAIMREFVEVFALPMMTSHVTLSLHNVVLALAPAEANSDHDMHPGLLELSSRCQIDLEYLHQQHQQHFVAFCSWSASDTDIQFFALQPSAHAPSPHHSTAFAVFGTSVKHVREGLTWLMRHTLLQSVSAAFGWVAPQAEPQPWTSLRSTQLAKSMVTMPMPELQQ
jgi:hypothetical protein